MKKTIALILTLVMLVALVACGGDKPTGSTPAAPSNPTEPSKPSEPAKPTEPAKPSEPEKPVDPDADKYGGDLIVATANAWTTFDPYRSTSTGNVCMNHHIYEPLGTYDANGKMYGVVCDIEESADGLTVKLTLRERYFSNGKKVTIEDVEASIRHCAALRTEAAFNKIWAGTTFKVEGDTIILTSEKYNVNLLGQLCIDYSTYKVMPKEILDKYPVTGGTMQPCGLVMGGTAPQIDKIEDAIGSGTYKLTAYTEEEVTLSRNEHYKIIENDAIGIAAPAKQYADTITLSLNKDASSRSAATIAGEYSIGSVTTDMQEMAKTMGVRFEDTGTAWTAAIFFNLHESNSDSPIYNVNIRKAIRSIVDADAVLMAVTSNNPDRTRYLQPYGVSQEGPYASTKMEAAGAYNIKDMAKAKEYMAQANYDGTPIIYMCPPTGNFYNTAMVVIPALESIGLKIEMKVVDSGSHAALRSDPQSGFDIGCWEIQKTLDPVAAGTFVCNVNGQGWWTNPTKTAAMEIMMSTPVGSKQSVDAYNDFLDAVIEDCPYIIFGHPGGLVAYRENVVKGSVGMINYYYWNDYYTDLKK